MVGELVITSPLELKTLLIEAVSIALKYNRPEIQFQKSADSTIAEASQWNANDGIKHCTNKRQNCLSDTEILFEALQNHRDNQIKEIEYLRDSYAKDEQLSIDEIRDSFTNGDFVNTFEQIKVLNNQIDNIATHALAILRQQTQPD